MPPKRYKETDGIVQWVNTSKTGRPRFKLHEQALTTEGDKPQTPNSLTQASSPIITEPGGEVPHDGAQPSNADMHPLGDFNNLEFPIKKRKTHQAYMQEWRDNKRTKYLCRLLSAYGRQTGEMETDRCPVCHLGRAVWRCRDCSDKRVFCVFCFRDRHAINLFHRVEKWNGRYFQRGGLWQVGVKIYVGHQGQPCPRSSAGLEEHNEFGGKPTKRAHPDRKTGIRDFEHLAAQLGGLADQFQMDPKEFIIEIYEMCKVQTMTLSDQHRAMLASVINTFGYAHVELIRNLRQAVMDAEAEADTIQAFADQQAAEQETVSPRTTTFDPLMSDIPIVDGVADDDEEWEDEDDGPIKGHVPRFLPRAPTNDGSGNEFLTIVHTNGFHSLPVVWCNCNNRHEDRDLQLLDLQLYPATYEKVKTVFTFACLDDYRLENLECKTSHYQYHQKLRRSTCSEYPDCIPKRYNELRRVTRQWRNLKYRKWFWIFKEGPANRGEMAVFCAPCPQPEVNLGDNWEEDYIANPSCYIRSFTADGNFKANHLKQKNDDVWLTDGEAFMTNNSRYEEHLAIAQETRVGSCHRHRAQLNAEASHNTADVSGIGGHCCARHGCFAPGSMVNFQKGERQMNMDWSLCEALATCNIGAIRHVLHIYDINCQYCRHLKERIEANSNLQIADHIQLQHAIGLFHVHGHKDDCLYQYATSYVPGAGMIDGEVMETLWAVMNSVSTSTRTASLAHRTEILDDHMNDSNFKKLCHIVKSIIAKYNRALENVTECRIAFDRLNDALPESTTADWETQIQDAESHRNERPEVMDIMHSKIKAGATVKQVTADLRRDDGLSRSRVPDDGTATNWLLEGLSIEEEQIRIRQEVRRLPTGLTAEDRQEIERRRQRVAARIRDFHTTSSRLLGTQAVAARLGRVDDLPPDGYVSDDLRDTPDRTHNVTEIETTALVFPSSISGNQMELVSDLREREKRLRRAKSNDALSRLRETLSGLSYQYINKVRQAKSNVEHLKSYQGVRLLTAEVSFQQQLYNKNRKLLVRLDPDLTLRYPYLRRDECQISTAVADVNARGDSQTKLSWFWGALDGYDRDMAQQNIRDPALLLEFYRVNWLRARAQKNRWEEELPRTQREMKWTTLYFVHHRNLWYSRRQETSNVLSGSSEYCEKKIHQWEEMGRIADFQFKTADPDYIGFWTPLVPTQ